MAVQIYTCSVFKGNQAKVIHNGDISVGGYIMEAGGTNAGVSTVGDTLWLCKIPHGATVVDFYEYHSTGATTQVLQVGISKGVGDSGAGGLSCLIAGTGAQATMNRFTILNWKTNVGTGNVGPPTISISDLDTVRYATVVAQIISGTTTTSLKVWFNIIYRMDGPQTVLAGSQAVTP